MKNLLVLDGNSIINRAFYGVRNLTRSDGMPTNALYGFINIVHRYIDFIRPEYMICTFDTHSPTFRHLKFDSYKCNRHGMPDELASQMPYAKKLAEAMGFTVLEMAGYEADDIIGTVCKNADEAGDIKSHILTGDRDSLQLISDRTTVILMRNKEDEIFDREHFFDVYGLYPEQFVDVKALMGDSSDCIPGVTGIGEKTALKLICAAGDLDSLYADEENGFFKSTPSIIKKLSEGKESAYMSKELATICREAPIGSDIPAYLSNGMVRSQMYSLLRELEFGQFIRKFGLKDEDIETETKAEIQISEVCEVAPSDISSLSLSDTLTVTFENGVLSFKCEKSNTVYICKNLDKKSASIIFSKDIICHDVKTLYKSVLHLVPDIRCVFDTMLAKYLTDPGKNTYSLESIAEFFGFDTPKDICEKVLIISSAAEILKEKLTETDMSSLLCEIEIPLAKVLSEVELRGFKVNRIGIKEYAAELLELEDKLAGSIYFYAGHDFNINSPKQLGQVLFDELMLPSGKKTKTGYSTDADTLKKLRVYHPIISDILAYRQIAKLRGTYGDALADLADENDRIHTSLNQCGTATGRLASNDPNLQNIPVREELGREIRKFFITENDDYILVDADYSQIELRLLAHLSGDENMISAFNSGVDVHTATAAKVFKISEDAVTRELRSRAKAVNFGIIYGIGAFSLSQDIGCTRRQAEEYIESYFETYPKVKEYLENTVNSAIENAYTTTMFGRRRYIPELKSSNKNVQAFGKRVAMNSPIQGSAADIIKLAMIKADTALKEAKIDAKIILQVHDELILECHKSCADKAKDILVTAMENAADLSVKLLAEASIGDNWFSAK